MLAEVPNVRQIDGERRRRWFCDENLDLIVWYEPDSAIYGFQLCYDKGGKERVVTWRRDAPLEHRRVDDGEGTGLGFKMSPILVADGPLFTASVLSVFRRHSLQLDRDLVDFVVERLAEPATGSGQAKETTECV